MLALCRLSTTKSFTFTVSLTCSLYHSIRCRDRAWSAGAGLYLSVPAGEAVLWLPWRNPDENAKAGHPAPHCLQHDNRYLSLSVSLPLQPITVSPFKTGSENSEVVTVALMLPIFSFKYFIIFMHFIFSFYHRAVTHHVHGCGMIRKIAVQ